MQGPVLCNGPVCFWDAFTEKGPILGSCFMQGPFLSRRILQKPYTLLPLALGVHSTIYYHTVTL